MLGGDRENNGLAEDWLQYLGCPLLASDSDIWPIEDIGAMLSAMTPFSDNHSMLPLMTTTMNSIAPIKEEEHEIPTDCPLQPIALPLAEKRRKVAQACIHCKRSHVSCDEQRPCQRCIKKGWEATCVDAPRKAAEMNSSCDSCPVKMLAKRKNKEKLLVGKKARCTDSSSGACQATSFSSCCNSINYDESLGSVKESLERMQMEPILTNQIIETITLLQNASIPTSQTTVTQYQAILTTALPCTPSAVFSASGMILTCNDAFVGISNIPLNTLLDKPYCIYNLLDQASVITTVNLCQKATYSSLPGFIRVNLGVASSNSVSCMFSVSACYDQHMWFVGQWMPVD